MNAVPTPAPPLPAPTLSAPPRRRWRAGQLGLVLALLGLLALAAGLSAGSEGWSWHWVDDAELIGAIRAPRSVGALAAGALLGLAGALAQGLFRNPLADPYLLGTAAGAGLGVVAVIAAGSSLGLWLGVGPGLGSALAAAADGLSRLSLVAAAFVGALAGVGLTLAVAGGATRPMLLLLAGVVVGVLLSALTELLTLLAPEALRGRQAFMLGTTGYLGWPAVSLLAAALALVLPLALRLAGVLDALVLGEASARSLGLDLWRLRLLLVLLMVAATATAVAQAGLVPFVGLVAPHAVRRLVTVRHGALLALSAGAGGVLLLGADVAARSVLAPQELPVGVLTALLGGGYLLLLLRRRAREGRL